MRPAVLAALFRRRAALGRELAEIDDAIAAELSPSTQAKKTEKPRKRRRVFRVLRRSDTPYDAKDEAIAVAALRKAGVL